jgi:hypothetical protein
MCAFDPLAELAALPPETLLALGSRGRAVKLLRRALALQGYGPPAWRNFNAAVSDSFDDRLKLVVLQFQRAVGLEADGVAGPQTLGALARPPFAARPGSPGPLRPDPLAPLREAAAVASGAATQRAIAVARQALALHIRETGGQNRGPLVEAIQRFAGGRAGEAWCGAFCAVCLRLGAQAAGEKLPLSIGLSCSRLVKRAHALGRVFEQPGSSSGEYPVGHAAPGDLLVLRGGRTGYKHMGIVVQAPEAAPAREVAQAPENSPTDGPDADRAALTQARAGLLVTIEGNTNDRGSAEGDGVYEKQRNLRRTPAVFVRVG